MLCEYVRTLYPNTQAAIQNNSSSFFICVYKYCGKRPYLDRENCVFIDKNETFVVKGNGLPLVSGIQFEIKGQWKKDKRGQNVLHMTSFTEVLSSGKMGIINYLTCGAIKGIGPKTAKAIYNTFGEKTIEILDKNPEKLLTVPGIKTKKLEQIMESYIAYKGPRAAISLLTPMGLSQKQAVSAYNKFGPKLEGIVKTNPYDLCRVEGLNFIFLDPLIVSDKNRCSKERVKAALLYILLLSEGSVEVSLPLFKVYGNTCVKIKDWLLYTQKILKGSVSAEFIYNCAKELINDELAVPLRQNNEILVSTKEAAIAEKGIAKSISLLLNHAQYKKIDIEKEIDDMENKVGFQLAPEQNNAVAQSLKNNVTVITGGPGTGKTTIVNFIRSIFAKTHPGAKIILCAPTGRAASRMTESTGCYATTIHKILGITPSENTLISSCNKVNCDLIIVDEISMLDVFLARALFSSIKKGAKVVLVGDVNQLPSIGPGAVLHDIIQSGAVPVARLTKVYRQGENSLIFLNALDICNGSFKCDTGDDFQIIPTISMEDSARVMQDLFLKEVATEGIDNVTMLSPFRKDTTATGVVSLNKAVHDKVNPPSTSKMEFKIAGTMFREGDKIIQTKNTDIIANGDIGYITKITPSTSSALTKITIDFGNDRIVDYSGTDMENVQLAYTTTVHKSQGSEYNTVILNIQKEHKIMLKKNLVYTAITRAKSKVIVVGDRFSLINAAREESEKRLTSLQERLKNI